MGYSKHTWTKGEGVTATKLNNIETGVETIDTGKKNKQTPVTGPTQTSGTTTSFVDTLSQDANGNISYTKKTVSTTDTKNTTGSTNTTDKIYLVGAKTQADNPQTYSNSNVYEQNGSLTIGSRKPSTGIGVYSFAQGYEVEASGHQSHAEGYQAIASQEVCHAEGIGSQATARGAHAENISTKASGECSHAEGYMSEASASQSHAEGQSYAEGYCSHAEGWETHAKGQKSHAEGSSTYAGEYGHSEGNNTYVCYKIEQVSTLPDYPNLASLGVIYNPTTSGTTASGFSYVANNFYTVRYKGGARAWEDLEDYASIEGGHSEGYNNVVVGNYAHAEGCQTFAQDYSHAEGWQTTATGPQSHAEGITTVASGNYSHAEGDGTLASGEASHAEGDGTIATGESSHAEGYYTTASGRCQHVQGRYNVELGSEYLDIVGNGWDSSERSNAYVLDSSGTGYYRGSVYVSCDSDTTGGKRLATESYVDSKAVPYATSSTVGGVRLSFSDGTLIIYTQ